MVALATYNKKNGRSPRELPPVAGGEPASDPVPVRRAQRRLGPDEAAALAQARQEGAEINDLAERFGVHRATVMAHLERAGVPGRRRQGRTLSPEQVQAGLGRQILWEGEVQSSHDAAAQVARRQLDAVLDRAVADLLQ